jgi:antirestriction protein
MTTLYAQPYDISAIGFYFNDAAEYETKVAKARNAYDQRVEEFDIQFIDGDDLDAGLFNALQVHQGAIAAFFDAAEDWTDDDKVKIIIAVGEAGYSFDLHSDRPDRFDVDLYECDSMRDLAMQFVDDGLFGEIPEAIQHYLDYDAIARDLAADYGEAVVAGARYLYRCG